MPATALNRPEKGMPIRGLVDAALFGTLWGALEVTMGSYLHILLPSGTAPLVGPIMAALGLAVALIGRHFAPHRGSLILMGAIAALVKSVGPGTVRWGALLGILLEAGVAESVLLMTRRPSHFTYIIGAALATASTLAQHFLFAAVFLGKSTADILQGLIYNSSRVSGLHWLIALLAALSGTNLALGALAGKLAWEVGRAAERRLARRWDERT